MNIDIRELLTESKLEPLRSYLQTHQHLVNSSISWGPQNRFLSFPLHFLSQAPSFGLIDRDKLSELAQILIEAGADLEAYSMSMDADKLCQMDDKTETPLHTASRFSEIDVDQV